jgi:hypothetical protein
MGIKQQTSKESSGSMGNDFSNDDVISLISDRINIIKWGKIEVIVRDAKVTQINTIEEKRLTS